MTSVDLTRFPVVIEVPVAWGEMDAFGHVNNAVYFRWFESARIALFHRVGWPEIRRQTGVGPILHSTSARFRAPLTYPDQLSVGTRVSELADDRFLMEYRVASAALGRIAAEGTGLIVAYDYRAGTKSVLPPAVAAAIRALAPLDDGPSVD
jgi:acyl-CoA thioester hydrolase